MTAPSWPPGWYPSPGGEPGWRYWDGSVWTERRVLDFTEYRALNRTSTTRVVPILGCLICALFTGMLGLVFLGGFAWDYHNYAGGTPARATVTECSGGKRNTCWAEWTTADGRSGRGVLVGGLFDGSDRVGTTLDVHVDRKGTSYTALPALGSAVGGGILFVLSIGFFIAAAVVFLIRKRR